MKIAKKVLLVLVISILVASLSISLFACNNNSNNAKTSDKDSYKVGICQLVQHAALDAATQGFIDALKAEVEKEGKKVEFDNQNASGDSNTCTTIVTKFVAGKYDLILGNATPALQAAYNATKNIPVLGTSITEYGVALEIKDFKGLVGSNVSGTSDLAPLDKQAAMFKSLLSDVKKVGVVYCSAEPNSKYQSDTIINELKKLGITGKAYTFAESNEIQSVVSKAVSENDALYIPTDNTCASNASAIDAIARPAKCPIIAGEEGIAEKCGIATLSISYYNLGYVTGQMAAMILLYDANVAKMSIKYDEAPVYKYNAAICADLGIKVPEDYVAIPVKEKE